MSERERLLDMATDRFYGSPSNRSSFGPPLSLELNVYCLYGYHFRSLETPQGIAPCVLARRKELFGEDERGDSID